MSRFNLKTEKVKGCKIPQISPRGKRERFFLMIATYTRVLNSTLTFANFWHFPEKNLEKKAWIERAALFLSSEQDLQKILNDTFCRKMSDDNLRTVWKAEVAWASSVIFVPPELSANQKCLTPHIFLNVVLLNVFWIFVRSAALNINHLAKMERFGREGSIT